MYKKTIENFEKIVQIPHCSFETSELAKFIINYAKECGFSTKEDEAGNILCQKGSPDVCLQSHYDMVCMGKAPKIETMIEDNWMSAKDSSLGADNGMGVAIMLSMMSKHQNLECLFTNNEEVGLLGAENLELEIKSQNLLNLDSEEADEVVIGCAGGVDIFGDIDATTSEINENLQAYEVSISGLDGGHSGVDIAKNIPNAIKLLANVLANNDCKIVSIEGGERINSIAKYAKATIFSAQKPKSISPFVKIKEISIKENLALTNSSKIINLINAFSQGVRMYDEDLQMPITSINISKIYKENNKIVIEFFARSMQDNELQNIKSETKSLLEGFGFCASFHRETSSWQPTKSPFALHVKSISQKHINNVKLHAVHAGLECGVIVKKQPSIKGVCSIGPTIMYPHSNREKCDLTTVEQITKVVDEIIS